VKTDSINNVSFFIVNAVYRDLKIRL